MEIKLVLPPNQGDLASLCPSFLELHGGGRRGVEEENDTASSWSASSTASRRPQAAMPSTPIAEGRLLRALSLVFRRHLYSNFPADVPNWRPSCSFSAAYPAPSQVATSPATAWMAVLRGFDPRLVEKNTDTDLIAF